MSISGEIVSRTASFPLLWSVFTHAEILNLFVRYFLVNLILPRVCLVGVIQRCRRTEPVRAWSRCCVESGVATPKSPQTRQRRRGGHGKTLVCVTQCGAVCSPIMRTTGQLGWSTGGGPAAAAAAALFVSGSGDCAMGGSGLLLVITSDGSATSNRTLNECAPKSQESFGNMNMIREKGKIGAVHGGQA